MRKSSILFCAAVLIVIGSLAAWIIMGRQSNQPIAAIAADAADGPVSAQLPSTPENSGDTRRWAIAGEALREVGVANGERVNKSDANASVISDEGRRVSLSTPLMEFGDVSAVLRDHRLNPNSVVPTELQHARLKELLASLNREAQVVFSDMTDLVDRCAQQKVADGHIQSIPLGQRVPRNAAGPDGVVVRLAGVDHQKMAIVREGEFADLDENLAKQRDLWGRGVSEIGSILETN